MHVRQTMLKRFLPNFIIFTLLWIVLTEGDLSSWPVAVPTIALASASFLLWPAGRTFRLNVLAAIWYAGYFLWRCFVAGLDVSRRVFSSRSAISPGIAEYKLQLPDAASRSLLANTVSLLPGTLSTAIDGDILRMHVLDQQVDVEIEISRFERLIAKMLKRRGIADAGSPNGGGA